MPSSRDMSPKAVYPPEWDDVAEIRVFRATETEWSRLLSWRQDMRRRGWKLLRVDTSGTQIVAIFGRTRSELQDDK